MCARNLVVRIIYYAVKMKNIVETEGSISRPSQFRAQQVLVEAALSTDKSPKNTGERSDDLLDTAQNNSTFVYKMQQSNAYPTHQTFTDTSTVPCYTWSQRISNVCSFIWKKYIRRTNQHLIILLY
ncbi:Hypothetical_protein [Hexamita inflata]|uniref:Hypothetical_protein n=1 Tax=Hexamita inflata TaxID=28002 RepID=A0AA86PZ78_9EUKA|nr:Hypothetical protein HINF_LOCUS31492 [Hexamita inflata]CAI9943850.1 Hypothetical protein HINF_LOCUS31495 [Hexamita inflata]CAI9943859.1 Hypothetical protein HINF_LOCUS31504 [Hexamita inflata]